MNISLDLGLVSAEKVGALSQYHGNDPIHSNREALKFLMRFDQFSLAAENSILDSPTGFCHYTPGSRKSQSAGTAHIAYTGA